MAEALTGPRKPSDLDHSYLRTRDNVFFCVGGNLHTPRSIHGQPYYFPRTHFERILDTDINDGVVIGGQEFCKVTNVITPGEYTSFVRENYPQYYYGPPMWSQLMRVDRDEVSQVFDPRGFTQNVRRQPMDEGDPLHHTIAQMEGFNPVLADNVGVTGSLLLHGDISRLGNDIDLVVYGRDTVPVAERFSTHVLDSDTRFSALTGDNFETYLTAKGPRYPGTTDQLRRMTEGRWDTLYVDDMKLDFTFADPSAHIDSYDYVPGDQRRLTGRVVDSSGAVFLPTVLDVESDDAPETVVMTSRGYICLFERGDVLDITGQTFHSESTGGQILVVNEQQGGYVAHA